MNPLLRNDRSRTLAVALAVAFGWLVYGVATLSQHGLTLDETSIFYAGDRTLFFLEHPTLPGALDFVGPHDPPGFHSRFPRFPDFADTWHYPVLPGLLMAVTDQMFHTGLHWVNDLDGHHLGLIALHALGLFAYTLFACRLLGLPGGLAAALAYALYPTIVGFAFNNPKDLPATDFYGAALLAMASAFAFTRPKDLWAAGVLVGLSLSCKLNGAFAVATLILWLIAARERPADLRARGLWRPLLALPAVAFALFFVLWPWLWYGTPLDWVRHLVEYVRFYLAFAHSARPTPTAFPFIVVGSMTPPLVLLSAALGLGVLFSRPGSSHLEIVLRPIRWLLIFWIALPLVRVAMPFSEFYDGTRHFIEYIGALCALAGIGFGVAWEWAARVRFGRAVQAAAAVVAALCVWLPLAAYRPFEGAYFNVFVGGLRGAQREALFYMRAPPHDSRSSGSEGDFWNSSLRGALELADTLLPPGAVLETCGPSSVNVAANVNPEHPPKFRVSGMRNAPNDYLYFMPRECYCRQADIRRAESERPVLVRVTRGGGLIYEILGPKVPYPLPPVSPHTRYEQLPHYPSRTSTSHRPHPRRGRSQVP